MLPLYSAVHAFQSLIILPLGKESSDFETQRETNDRALSRTLHLLNTNQRLHFLPPTAAGKHRLSSSELIQAA